MGGCRGECHAHLAQRRRDASRAHADLSAYRRWQGELDQYEVNMIIEALIAYIQEKGYRVSVMTESLLIWKIANGQRFNRNWAISKAEISQAADKQLLFMEADLQMIAIKKAIEQSARRATSMNMTETY